MRTGGADFEEVRGRLLKFDAGSENGSMTCFSFDIIDDMIVEKNQNFSLHVKLEDRNVWIKGSTYLPLIIYDNDSKLSNIQI